MKRTSHQSVRAVLLWLLVLALAVSAGSEARKKDLIFELTDPRDDDHGNGRMVYPLSSDFAKGDLDMVAFRALEGGDETIFEVEFARQIRVPEAGAIDELGTDLRSVARHDFYTFNVDVYIDTDRQPESGGYAMVPGRLAEVDPAHGWERAVILTPRPAEAKREMERLWIRSMSKQMRDEREERDDAQEEIDRKSIAAAIPDTLERRMFFPTKIRVQGRKIRFYVPDSFLQGKAKPEWSYVVVVSGADLQTSFDLAGALGEKERQLRLMILPVSPGTWQERFGGGRDEAPLQPPLIDILVPEGASQERLLSDFNSREDRPVRLPGVVPAASP